MIPRLDMLTLSCRTSSYECKTVANRILGSAFFFLGDICHLNTKSIGIHWADKSDFGVASGVVLKQV
jgi:hypothetical protein